MQTLLLLSLLSLPHSRADWLNYASGAADAAQTCAFLHAGSEHESWLPSQNCAADASMIMGAKAAETVVANRCHRKFCHAVPWIATAGSMLAIGYSEAHNSAQQHCSAVPSATRATYACH